MRERELRGKRRFGKVELMLFKCVRKAGQKELMKGLEEEGLLEHEKIGWVDAGCEERCSVCALLKHFDLKVKE